MASLGKRRALWLSLLAMVTVAATIGAISSHLGSAHGPLVVGAGSGPAVTTTTAFLPPIAAPTTTTSMTPTTTTTRPVVTTTTAARVTTTTAPPLRHFSITPSPSHANWTATATGDGCHAPDGINVGLWGPDRTQGPIAMTATEAPKSGPWSQPLHLPMAPGKYTAYAGCGLDGHGFVYAEIPYTVVP